jgi:hypothetical protein
LWIVLIVTAFIHIPAEAVTFTFDDLSAWSGPDAVSAYMSGLYESQVSVRGSMIGPLFDSQPFGPDPYLFSTVQAGGPLFFPFSIDIGFEVNPIESLSFEGAVFGDNPGHDFRLWAYTDGGSRLVHVSRWDTPIDNGVWWFEAGPITFDVPIDRLVFSDNWIYDVAIDNLTVTPVGGGMHVPVPASITLGFVGLGTVVTLIALRRRVLGGLGRAA